MQQLRSSCGFDVNMILVARDYQELGIPRLVVNTIDPDPVSMQQLESPVFHKLSIHNNTPRTKQRAQV